MATYGGDLSLERFLALEARAIPFDAAHAIGNVAFALIAGPAMVRMLARFRERFEWRRGGGQPRPGRAPARLEAGAAWRRRRRRAVRAIAVLAPAPAEASDVGRAADWLESVAERGRRLRPLAGRRLERRNDLLGDARAGGRRAQPARRLPRRQHPGRLPAPHRRRAGERRRPRPHDPRPRGRRRRPAQLRRPRPGLAAARHGGATTAPTKAGPTRTAFAVIALRAAGATAASRSRSPGCARSRTTTAAGATIPARRATPTAPAPCCRRSPRSKAAERGLSYLRQAPAPERRLRPRRQRRRQLPVDRLGDPGDARRRRRPRLLPPRWRSASDYLAAASSPTATTATRSSERPDPGLGHRPGPGRRQPTSTSRSRHRHASRSRTVPASSRPAPLRRHRPADDVPVARICSGLASPGRRWGWRILTRRRSSCTPRARPPPWRRPATSPPAGRARKGAGAVASETSTPIEDDSGSGSDSSAVGAILARPGGRRPAFRRRLGRPPRLDALALRAVARAHADGLLLRRMDVETAIRTRRTHKAFGPEPLPREQIDELLELASWAPNHHLTAPWRFRVIGPAALERLKEAAGPGGRRQARPRPDPGRRLLRARRRPGPGRGGPARDRGRLLHRPARRPRPRPRRLLAHARPAARRRRAAPRSACPTDERFVGLLHLGHPRQEKAAPASDPAPTGPPTYLRLMLTRAAQSRRSPASTSRSS